MSVTEPELLAARLVRAIETTRSSGSQLYRIPIYCACSILAIAVTYLLGKDLPWDALDYHLYAGFSAVHDRFAQDYFAAGPQSYFIPYAYVPFYALVRAGLSSLQIAAIAALVQSAILWLTYELTLRCCTAEPPRRQVILGLCAVAWVLVNPILLQQFGSSHADITTAELILGGWLCMVRAVSKPRLGPVLWAGLIVGTATALKLTNAVHALSASVMLLFVPANWRDRLRMGIGYAGAAAAGFVAVAAPWSYRLEQQFGNPLFPLLNGWFRSPEFVTARLTHYRFIPDSLASWLWRPFAVAKPMFMVQEELRAPDVRYALLLLLAIGLVAHRLIRRWRPAGDRNDRSAAAPAANSATDARVLAALGCALAIDWSAWLTVSGNGRYFLPMACVTAVVSMGLLFRMLARQPKMLGYVLAAMFLVQGTQLVLGAEYRWNANPWDDHWVDVEVPPPLARQPNLYFTMAFQSNSFLAAYLPIGSGFVDIAGGYAPSPTGASGVRIAELIRRYSPHLRTLVEGASLYEDGKNGRPSGANMLLAPFGLGVDRSDCQTIVLKDLHADAQAHHAGTKVPATRNGVPMVSCRVVPAGPLPAALLRSQHNADLVLDRLEQACPRLFQPRGVRSWFEGRGAWVRYYLNTDELAWVSRGGVKFDDQVEGEGVTYLGKEADWLRAPQRVVCGRRNGHYYARLVTPR